MKTYRCIIRKVKKKHYIGQAYNNTYKILKNDVIGELKVGTDIEFYAHKLDGFFLDTLVPMKEDW